MGYFDILFIQRIYIPAESVILDCYVNLAGFQVFDLGIDVSPDEFVNAAKKNDADLIAMSALLTLTIQKMKETIEAIKEAGLKNETRIMVGGAPVTQNIADQVGADGYAPDCARAVERAKELLGLA